MSIVTADLLRRYDRPGPRYTSYPTAVEFHEGVDAAVYGEHLERAAEREDEPLSLYVHLPFCEERCLYCGCNVVIAKEHDLSLRYLEALEQEIRAVARQLGPRRKVQQYHWGGGTPSYQSPEEMRALQAVVRSEFEIEPDAEVAIEVDPRVTTQAQLETLREIGFNRISMGVQDFTPEVQKQVHRVQPFEMTRDHVAAARALGFGSVNVDLIYGLPLQTPSAFQRTLDQVIEIRPERVAVYSYAHVPWLKGQQRRLMEENLPTPEMKLELFASAVRSFQEAGYLSIGMDHFALPEDEMGQALEAGTLWRNFMGYTVRHAPDMVGCGMSSIGDVQGAFFQNEKKLNLYQEAVGAGRLPVARGFVLSDDDKLRRHVITSLMATFRVDVPDVERRFGISFWEAFRSERKALEPLEADGFVRVTDDRIEVLGDGRLFIRNVCMVFDAYLSRHEGGKPRFSRTV